MAKETPTNLLPDDERKEAKEALAGRSQAEKAEVKLVMPKSQESSEPGVPEKKESFWARFKRKRAEKRAAEKRKRGETGAAKEPKKHSDQSASTPEAKPELFANVEKNPEVPKKTEMPKPEKPAEKESMHQKPAEQKTPPKIAPEKESPEKAPLPPQKPQTMAVKREVNEEPKAPVKEEKTKPKEERKPFLSKAMHEPEGKAPEKFSGPSVNLVPDTMLDKEGGPTWMLPVIILVFVTGFWVILGGVAYSQVKSAEAQITEQTGRLNSIKKLISDSERAKVAAQTLQKQFDAVEGLLDAHIYWTPVLSRLEEATIPDVYYVAINGNATTGEISLRAIAKNYAAAARQLRSFESSRDFIADMTIGEARVENQPDAELPVPIVAFDLQLQLTDNVLQLLEPES